MTAPRALLALGSNLGDRARAINRAVAALSPFARVTATSSLYESAPQYVQDQPSFLNAVVEVITELQPSALLHELKRVERALGRRSGVRWGPREIDLDLVLYGEPSADAAFGTVLRVEATHDAPHALELPHPRLAERDFVLEPLAECAPNAVHPVLGVTAADLCARLEGPRPPLRRVTPLLDGSLLRWGSRTHLMGVLNVTPDSFSDGGRYAATDAAVAHGMRLEAEGADILDVGAQSTRPGAAPLGPSEELERAAPVVRGLRAAGLRIPISVDTFHAPVEPPLRAQRRPLHLRTWPTTPASPALQVAEELLRLGAALVNDVSGGTLDAAMLPTLARLGAPAVLMHTRGSPTTMAGLSSYGDVVAEVRRELDARLDAAAAAGIPRWALLSDPGIGFAKRPEHSLALLRAIGRFGASRAEGGLGVPLVLGVSRKSFIGALLGGAEPAERGWGTAGACVACVPHADVLRVHDVREIKQAVAVADAIRRP